MKNQINTIREALDRATRYTMLEPDAQAVQQALTALSELEAMAGSQEPVAWQARFTNEAWRLCAKEHHELVEKNPIEWRGYETRALYAAPVAQLETMVGEPWLDERGYTLTPLHTAAPVAQQYEAGDMASAAAQGFRDGVASVAQQPQCVCGQPTSLGVVHRTDGPCFVYEAQQPQAEHSLRQDALQTLAYVNGAKHGWNLAVADDEAGFQRLTDRVSEAMQALKQPQADAVPPDVEVIRKALERAFIMGQNYWADADSESYSANKRSDVTRQKFNAMRDEVCAAIAQQKGGV